MNLSQCLAFTNGNANLMDIVQIDGGDGHIIALNDAGDVFTMGNDSYGQLGRNGAQHVPLPVNFNGFLIDNVSAGGDTSLAEACDNIWIFGKETWSSETLPEDPFGDPRDTGPKTPSYAGFGTPYLFHEGERICVKFCLSHVR